LLPEDSTDVSKTVGKAVGHSVNGRAMDVDGEVPQLQSLLDDDDTAVDELDELDLDSTVVAAAVWDGTGTFKMKTAALQVNTYAPHYYVLASSSYCYGIGHAAGVSGVTPYMAIIHLFLFLADCNYTISGCIWCYTEYAAVMHTDSITSLTVAIRHT
jgi:hypothetical protein